MTKFNTKMIRIAVASFISFNSYALKLPDVKNVLISQGRSSEEIIPQVFDVLVWNIHKESDKPFAQEFEKFSKNKDLLILQEIKIDQRMTDYLRGFVRNRFMSATSFLLKNDIPTGVSTGSKYHINSAQFLRSKNVEPISSTPKMILATTYEIEGSDKDLLVINIHALNFVTNNFWENQIDAMYNEFKNYDGPIIFAGDFNTWNQGRLDYLKRICKKMGLKAVTFKKDIRKTFMGKPLDHILYNKYLELVDSSTNPEAKGSDHIPLNAKFRMINL